MFEHIDKIVVVALAAALTAYDDSFIAVAGGWVTNGCAAFRVESTEQHGEMIKEGEELLRQLASEPISLERLRPLRKAHIDDNGTRANMIDEFKIATALTRIARAAYPDCIFEIPAKPWSHEHRDNYPVRVVKSGKVVGLIMGLLDT